MKEGRKEGLCEGRKEIKKFDMKDGRKEGLYERRKKEGRKA